MILSDREIERAIRDGRIIITPAVESSQFDSSALNLRVGDDFRIWKESLRAKGTAHAVELDSITLSDLDDLTDPLVAVNGVVTIRRDAFALVRTHEQVNLPIEGRIAARVEGRSKQARLGLTAHITAPTVHAGFIGNITLEIKNFGPFDLQVVPRQTCLCQLIFEEVRGIPKRGGSRTFSDQSTPLGSPRTSNR